jgi:hypothetical protein
MSSKARTMTQNQRKAKRQPLTVRGMIYDLAGKSLAEVDVRNISMTGAQVEMLTEIDLPPAFVLAMSASGTVRRACEKVWQTGTAAGVSFYEEKKR